MRKWLLVIIGIVVLGCGPAPSTTNSNDSHLVKKIYLNYHHTENCSGHHAKLSKITFEDEGHTMWMYWYEGSITIIDSPDCPICHPKKPESILEETPESDYWGW